MSEKSELNFSRENKVFFAFGFVSGVSIVSLVLFFVLIGMVLGGKAANFGKAGSVTDTAFNIGNNAPAPSQQVAAAEPVPAIKDGEHILGNPDAPIEIIEYSDFECPFCSRFTDTMKQVVEEYDGQVKVVYRHFPLSFHPNAQKAGEAAECAGEQGKFWPMHDKIFEYAAAKNMSVQIWKDEARKMGLNGAQFDECLDSDKFAAKVQQDALEGQAAGVTGTPGTFVNGTLVSGAVPFAQMKSVIDAALAEAK
jgi:protein-disulfide isomerase